MYDILIMRSDLHPASSIKNEKIMNMRRDSSVADKDIPSQGQENGSPLRVPEATLDNATGSVPRPLT